MWSIGATCHFFRCPFLFKQIDVVDDLITNVARNDCVSLLNVNSILTAIYVDDGEKQLELFHNCLSNTGKVLKPNK